MLWEQQVPALYLPEDPLFLASPEVHGRCHELYYINCELKYWTSHPAQWECSDKSWWDEDVSAWEAHEQDYQCCD